MAIDDILNPNLPMQNKPDPNAYLAENFMQGASGIDPKKYMPNQGLNTPEIDMNLMNPDEKNLFKKDMMNRMSKNLVGQSINPYQFGKEAQFGASLDHHAYERYYAHNDFEDLGFSPFRDNESLYNENSSFWDEMSRASGQWWTLTGLGFRDALGFGDLDDMENARKFEKAMAIGQSTKGGFTGFATNLYLNSGYTFGIMAELAAEEIALAVGSAVLAVPSGGSSAVAGGSLMAARGARASHKIYKGWNASRKLLNAMDKLKDINKARTTFQKVGGRVFDFLNPASETTKFIRNYKKLDNLTDLQRTGLGFASVYRDVRNIRLAWGESGLEGGMVENQMRDDLLEEHWKMHNRAPTEAEMQRITNLAKEAGMTTGWHNLATIFYSNKLVFDNMFKAFSPFGKYMDDVVTGNAAGRIMFKRGAKDPFTVLEKGWKGFKQSIKNPGAYLRAGGNYFTANFAEGLQEVAQESISGAAMDYYMNEFKGTPSRGGYYALIGDNLKKQISPEGLEIFASGFLMGGLVQPVTRAPKYIKQTYSKFKDPASFNQMKAERVKYLNETVNTLNELYNDPAKYFNADTENAVNQSEYAKGMKQAAQNGDAKSFYDISDQSAREHIYTALKMGRMDTLLQRMEEMKGFTKEEVETEFNMNYEDFQRGLDNSIARAKRIESRYNGIQRKFENPFNRSKFKFGTEEYLEEALNQAAFERAQRDAIFMQDTFDRTTERMESILRSAKDDAAMKNTATSDFSVLFTIKDTQAEIDQLRKEIEALGPEGELLTPESKQLRQEKQAKMDLLNDFLGKMTNLMSQPGKQQVEALDEKGRKTATEGRSKAVDEAYESFENYLKTIGKTNGDHVFSDNVQEAFKKLVDFYEMSDRADKVTDSINALIDPGAFTRHAKRIAEVMKQQHENKKAAIEESLKSFMEAKETNDLFQLLHDAGMFMDPEQYQNLKQNGVLPDTFYYVNTKEEVQIGSEDWDKAISIIKKMGIEIMGLPIKEAQRSPYNQSTRNKINNDQRTYEDLAEQFGFDPESASSKVPLPQVLQAIVDSEYATYREKALAKQLLSIASQEETVTFVNNNEKSGHYSEVEQTVVDARYASSDYQNAGHPIEHIILHQEIRRRTTEALKEDTSFKKDIGNILERARKHFENPEVKEQWGGRIPEGLSNVENFVAEAMSNDRFQAFLAEVPYEAGNQSGWTNFVDSVVNFMKKLFGRKISNTALNGAFNVISAKIDERYGAAPATAPVTEEAQVIELAQRIARGETPSSAADLQLQDNYPDLLEKALAIEKARADEMAENAYRIPVARESRSYTLGDGTQVEVRVTTMQDGSRVVQEIITAPEQEAIAGEKSTYKAELPLEKIYEVHNADQEEYGAPVELEVPTEPKVVRKVNEKYDAQLAKLTGGPKKTRKKTIKEAKGDAKITRNVTTEELNSPRLAELRKQLVRAYKEEEGNRTDEGINNLNDNWSELSEQQILESTAFKTYVKRFSKPGKIINDFNEATGRTEEPVVQPKVTPVQATRKAPSGVTPTIMTREMRGNLADLGYTEAEINGFSPGEAQILIEEGIPKSEREAMDAAAAETMRQELSEQRANVRAELEARINSVKNLEELDAMEIDLIEQFMDPRLREIGGITGEYIQELIAAKKEELAFSFTFEDIQEGEVVILNDEYGTKMVVDGKTGNTLMGHRMNDVTKRYRIKKDTVTDRIKYRYSPAMEEVGITPETAPTEDEQEFSNEAMQEVINSPEATQEMIKKAREGGDTGWLDNINECK